MSGKILKFPEPNIQSHPVPNNVEEAKKLVEEHVNSFNILLLMNNKPAPVSNPTLKQRIMRFWPFQNCWQLIGALFAFGGHIALWSFMIWYYKIRS